MFCDKWLPLSFSFLELRLFWYTRQYLAEAISFVIYKDFANPIDWLDYLLLLLKASLNFIIFPLFLLAKALSKFCYTSVIEDTLICASTSHSNSSIVLFVSVVSLPLRFSLRIYHLWDFQVTWSSLRLIKSLMPLVSISWTLLLYKTINTKPLVKY